MFEHLTALQLLHGDTPGAVFVQYTVEVLSVIATFVGGSTLSSNTMLYGHHRGDKFIVVYM